MSRLLSLFFAFCVVFSLVSPGASYGFNPREKFKAPKFSRSEIESQIWAHPKDPEPQCLLGELYFSAAETEKALSAYSRALELDPKFSRAYWRRSQCYVAMNKFGLALKDAETGLKLGGPYSADLIMQKIDCYKRLGREKDCIAEYSRLIDSKNLGVGPSDRAHLLVERAELYLKMGKPGLAIADLNAVPNGRFQQIKIREERTKAYIALKDYRAAIRTISEAIEFAQKDKDAYRLPALYKERARIYKMLGKNDMADADLKLSGAKGYDFFDAAPFRSR